MKRFLLSILFFFFASVVFSQNYTPNEHVLVQWKGSWYAGKIISVKGDQYYIGYDGFGADLNENVGAGRLRKMEMAGAQVNYVAGEQVFINWKGQWCPGEILSINGSKYLVSYDGYDASWNELVGTDRLMKGETISNFQNEIVTTVSTEATFKSVETIWDIDRSADGQLLFAASAYGNVKILKAADLSLVTELKLGKDPLMTVAVSSDASYFVAGGGKEFSIYKKNAAGDYGLYASFDTYFSVARMRFIPSTHDFIIIGAPKEDYLKTQIDIWNVEDKKIKMNLAKSTNAEYCWGSISISRNGDQAAFGISNRQKGIDVYDLKTGKLSYHIKHTADVVSCAFSPDGNTIASGGTDRKVTLWSVATKKPLWSSVWKPGETDYLYSVDFSSDGKMIAACGTGTGAPVKLFASSGGALVKELGTTNPGGNAIRFDGSSNSVFVAFTTYGDIAKVAVVQKFSLD